MIDTVDTVDTVDTIDTIEQNSESERKLQSSSDFISLVQILNTKWRTSCLP